MKNTRLRILLIGFTLLSASFLNEAAQAASCPPVSIAATWSSYGAASNNTIYSGPGGRMLNNCPSYAPTGTELADDTDGTRNLNEADYSGTDRPQLCIGSSVPDVSLTSQWVNGSCPSNTVTTGIYDRDTTGTNVNDKSYIYRHNLNEEESGNNNVNWCLGLSGPEANNYDLEVRKANSTSCNGDETKLIQTQTTGSNSFHWNVNTENDNGSQQSLCVRVVVKSGASCGPSNNAPNPPTITGPTTGTVGTHTFNFQATDPDNDTLRYGVDWDRNGSVDQWLPGSGYVASNILQSGSYTWATPGAYTFQALTEDSQGFPSGWTQHSITLSSTPTPTANLTINGSDGPLTVALGSNLALSWTSANATSCIAYGAGWGSATPVAVNGTQNVTASQGDTYIVQCTGPGGTATDQVVVTLQNSLKICQGSCNSSIEPPSSFTMAQGSNRYLVACYNPAASCTDPTGNITGNATWSEDGGSNVVTITAGLDKIDPMIINANQMGTEYIQATYLGQTVGKTITVLCLPTVSCANAPGAGGYCQGQTFNVDNGCGVSITCNGIKTCNYNWKEVAP